MGLLLNSGIIASTRVSVSAALSVSTLSVDGSVDNASCVNVPASLSCSPSGGVPPYTYSWVKVSGDATSFDDSPTTQNPDILFTSVCPQESQSATFEVTVTDSNSDTTTSSVSVSAQNTAQVQALSVNVVGGSGQINSGACDDIFFYAQANVSGGTPPYTYSWSKVSGDGQVNGGTSATCEIQFTSVCPQETQLGEYQCLVTDANSNTDSDSNFVVVDNLGA